MMATLKRKTSRSARVYVLRDGGRSANILVSDPAGRSDFLMRREMYGRAGYQTNDHDGAFNCR